MKKTGAIFSRTTVRDNEAPRSPDEAGQGIPAKANQQGFTLMEIIIAIMILTIGLLAVAKMQVSAIRGNYMSSNTTAALALAEKKMEDLLQKEYTHADLGNGNHEQANINEAGQAGGIYHRIWVVQDDTPISNTKTIIVTVRWDRDRHHVSLSCIKAQ